MLTRLVLQKVMGAAVVVSQAYERAIKGEKKIKTDLDSNQRWL
jgi:hypothetical protein